jgi:hypothetical protein
LRVEDVINFKILCMKNISAKNDNATVCIDRNCITVHGETAKIVNFIIIVILATVAINTIVTMLKNAS